MDNVVVPDVLAVVVLGIVGDVVLITVGLVVLDVDMVRLLVVVDAKVKAFGMAARVKSTWCCKMF